MNTSIVSFTAEQFSELIANVITTEDLEPETEPCERCGGTGIKQTPSIPAAHRVE